MLHIVFILELLSRKIDIDDVSLQPLVTATAELVLGLVPLSAEHAHLTLAPLSPNLHAILSSQPPLAPLESLCPSWCPLPAGLAFLSDPALPLPDSILSTPGSRAPTASPSPYVSFSSLGVTVDDPLPTRVTCRLLALLSNLSRNPAALLTFVQSKSPNESLLSRFVAVFKLQSSAVNVGLTTTRRHLARVLARLFGSGFYQPDHDSLATLQSCRIIATLAEAVRSSTSLPNVICFEVCQLLVCLLRAAPPPLSLSFMTEFIHCDGYEAFGRALHSFEKTASKEQQRLLLATFIHLGFVDRPHDPLGALAAYFDHCRSHLIEFPVVESLMYTVNFFNSLLCAFAEADSMKAVFLRSLGEAFVLHLDKSDELAELGVFKLFLGQFNSLSVDSRIYVLRLLKRALSSGSASNFTLQNDELTSYIELLRRSSRSSSVFLVCLHLTRLIEHKRISRSSLRERGLLDILVEYLSPTVLPAHGNFVAPESADSFVPEEVPTAEADVRQCLEILGKYDRKAQVSALAELSAENNAPKASFLSSALSTLRGLPPISRVSYAVHLAVLDLLRTYLSDNSLGQDEFRQAGCFGMLFALLEDPFLRRPALQIASCIALEDVLATPSILTLYLGLLQPPAVSQSMAIRTEVLSSLRSLFMRSHSIQSAFCSCSGMEKIVQLLQGFAELPFPGSEEEVSVIAYQLELMDMLAWSWRGHAENLSHFRESPLVFPGFRDALSLSTLVKRGSCHVILADSLISMSLPAGWPPACPMHAAHNADRFRGHGAGSALSVARERSQTCLSCREMLKIENPETLKLLIEFIVQREESQDGDAVVDTAFILTLKAVKFLVEIVPLNAQILSSSGWVLHVLENLRPVLLKDPSTSSRARSRQPLLLGLVERIAQYSTSSLELRRFLELLRSPSCPSNVLATLTAISSRSVTPTHYLMFQKRKPSSVSVPIAVQRDRGSSPSWPGRGGHTISLWFNVDSFGDSNSDRSVVHLFALDAAFSAFRYRFDAYLFKGVLTVQSSVLGASASANGSSSSSSATFNEVFFEENQWYHLLVSQKPSSAALGGRKSTPSDSPSSKGDVELWLDGRRFFSGQNISAAPSATRLLFPCPAPASSVQFSVGNFSDNLSGQDTGPSNASWSVGNVIMLDCALELDYEAYLLYCLGPNFVGSLADLRGSSVVIPDAISPQHLHGVADSTSIFQHPANYSLGHLHEKINFFFSARDCLFSRPSAGSSKLSPLDKVALVDQPATRNGTMISCRRAAVKDLLVSVGGVSAILHLIANARSEEHQLFSLGLLRNVLAWNAVNLQQMAAIAGYEILARILRRPEWVLSESVLESLFAFAGVTRSKKRLTFSDSIIGNAEVLQHLLLDWKIWVRAPDSVQLLLFKSLSELASTSEHAHFNVLQMRTVKIRTILLMMLEDDDFPYSVAQHVVLLLGSLMHDPWNVADIKAVFRYIVATHNGSESVAAPCPQGVENHKSLYYTGISSGSRPTASRLKTPATVDLGLVEGSWVDLGDHKPSKSPLVRNLVLLLLVESLSGGAAATRSQFFDLCNLEIIFSLLNSDNAGSRILLLRLLEIFLRDSTNAARFKRVHGFYLLGDTLRSYPVDQDTVFALTCIMLGRPFSLGALPALQLSPASGFVHPEMIVSIIAALSSCTATVGLQHSVLSFLRDLFNHDEKTPALLCKTGIVPALCTLLTFLWEHRTSTSNRASEVLAPPSMSFEIEMDVFALLLAVAEYGCFSSELENVQLFETALTALDLLPLSRSYAHGLQKRMIHDILGQFVSTSSRSANLPKVVALSVGHWTRIVRLQVGSTEGSSRRASVPVSSEAEQLGPAIPTSPSKPSVVDDVVFVLDVPRAPEQDSDLAAGVGSSEPLLSLSVPSSPLARSAATSLSLAAPLLVSDSQVFCTIVDAISSVALARSQTSPFKRLRQALKRKTIGVSSVAEIESDLSWQLEKAVFQTMGLLRDHADAHADLLVSVLDRGAQFSRADLFFSETEYLARFLFLSYPLLSSSSDVVCDACWSAWKQLLLETPTKLISKIVLFTANSALLAYKRGDESNLKFVSGIDELVAKAEQSEQSLSRQWLAKLSESLRDTSTLNILRLSAIKQFVSACSTKIIEMQQVIIKPLIEYLRGVADREKRVRASWRALVKRLTHGRGIWPLPGALVRWELDATEGCNRVRLRLKPRRSHKHPILGSSANPFQERFSRDPRTLFPDYDPRQIEALRAFESHLDSPDSDLPLTPGNSHEWIVPPSEKVQSVFLCSQITPFHRREGELLLGEQGCYFVDTHKFQTEEEERRKYTSVRKHRAWCYLDIRQLHKRRYMLVDNALEIFLVNGKTYLFAFENRKERDSVSEAVRGVLSIVLF